jgi:histidinol-phosphatase
LPKLLAGELEAVFALHAGPWDFAPGVVLIEEAGGRFQDPSGGHSIFLGAGIFSNGSIDEHVSLLLRGDPRAEDAPTRTE